jgi:homoserine kinase
LKEVIVKAPATIANFGPGFDVFSLALEEPYDIVKVRLNDKNSINVKIVGMDEGIPTSVENNTAGLAAARFFEEKNPSKGVDVEIRKRMISCAGLGSSGASAVACVYGLNILFGANLGHNEIIEIASLGEIASGGVAHADNVAGCLLGGFVLIKNYHPIDVVKIEVPNVPIVICVIKKAQRTTRKLIPNHISLTEAREQISYCSSLIYAISAGNLKDIGEAVNRDQISEPVRSRFIPGYDDIKKKVLKAGAYGCNVSGGGSSIFAICEEDKTGEIAEIMKNLGSQGGVENNVIITKASNTGVVEINGL